MPGPYRILGVNAKWWALFLGLMFIVWPAFMAFFPEEEAWLFGFLEPLFTPLARAHDQLLSEPPSGWFATALWVIFWPGYLLLSGVERVLQALGISGVLTSGWALVPVAVLVFGSSYIVWSTTLVRSRHFLGLWDPFASGFSQGRRFILQALIRVREWAESNKFGRQPTGGWASLLEVLSNRWLPGDIFLGRPKLIAGGMMRPIGLPTEKHIVTLAYTGSGKSTAALIPNLCIYPGSAVVVDPKGELALITARRRGQGGNGVRGMGQDVHVLDPFGTVATWRSAAYNPFDEMARIAESDPDRPVSYAGLIAQALVRREGERDPYWNDSATTLLRGLILYIFVHEPPERRNLGRLRQLIMEGDVDAHLAASERGDLKPGDGMSAFDVLFMEMTLARQGLYGSVISGAAHTIMEIAPPQRGGVISTAQEQTSFLDAPEIQRACARSDFLLDDLKRKDMSVYLCLPLHLVAGKESRWLRMFVLLLGDMMSRARTLPKIPILLAIDEFPSLGKLDGISLMAPAGRAMGVRFWTIGQDLSQFREVYPQTWEDFIGNAECVQFLGIKNPTAVDMVVRVLNKHVVVTRGPRGVFREVRSVLESDQVGRLLSPERKNQIIWRGNARPMLLKTTPYYWYLPPWYYDADPHHPEPWPRRLWRSFYRPPDDKKPPPEPPPPEWKPPEDKPPDDRMPPRIRELARRSYESYLATKDDPPPPPTPLEIAMSRWKPGMDIDKINLEVAKEYPDDPWSRKILKEHGSAPPPPPGYYAPGDEDPYMEAAKGTWTERIMKKDGDNPDDPPPEDESGRKPDPYDFTDAWRKKLADERRKADAPRPGVTEPSDSGLDELGKMVGLEAVKLEVSKLVSLMKLQKARRQLGKPDLSFSYHLVFTGNPGTGKTTVARTIGRIYKDLGVLRKGHMVETNAAGLIAGYTGQTALKTEEIIKSAVHGVLFIDEAYGLYSENKEDSFGAQAVTILTDMMEKNRDKLAVIVAGYPEQMKKLIASNPGLRSRFKTTIHFPDYDLEALTKIFDKIAADAGCRLSLDARVAVRDKLEDIKETAEGDFGNGRDVRILFEDVMTRLAGRLAGKKNIEEADVTMIEAEDIPKS